MSSDDRETTEDHASELDGLSKVPRAQRVLAHQLTVAREQLAAERARNAAQGNTIYALRCQLAEARELSSKIERGELRLAERRIADLLTHNRELREKLIASERDITFGTSVTADSATITIDAGNPLGGVTVEVKDKD